MRIAIVSDIHANLAAFEAVLRHAKSVGYDRMVCLGDVIGYGPDPVECIDLVREHCEWSLLGNHDFAALYEPTNFNAAARDAVFWTRAQTIEQGWMKRRFCEERGLAIPTQRTSTAKSASVPPCIVGLYRYELTEGGNAIYRSHNAGSRFEGPGTIPLAEPAEALIPCGFEEFLIRYASGELERVAGAHDAALFNAWAASPRHAPKARFDLKAHGEDPRWKELLAEHLARVDFMFSISPRQILLDRYICVHASPSRPVNEYLFPDDVTQAERKLRRNFAALELPDASGNRRRVSAIVGHTHCPGFLLEEVDDIDAKVRAAEEQAAGAQGFGGGLREEEVAQVNYDWVGFDAGLSEWAVTERDMPPRCRFILNPGSVGQPRDHDPRSSYVMLDEGVDGAADRFTFHRVEYDIKRTQDRIKDLIARGAPLKDWLWQRLEKGE
jgi:predicted phosphodiesterase